MRLKIGPTPADIQKREDRATAEARVALALAARRRQWHVWFAWFPVEIAQGEYAWLEQVERREEHETWEDHNSFLCSDWVWSYRPVVEAAR